MHWFHVKTASLRYYFYDFLEQIEDAVILFLAV